MKPFNLERALAGDPVVTRDGRPVTQLTLFEVGRTRYRLYGVCDDMVQSWRDEGVHCSSEDYYREEDYIEDAKSDLFMAPREVWVIVLECTIEDDVTTYDTTFRTKEEAEKKMYEINNYESFDKVYIRSITLEN